MNPATLRNWVTQAEIDQGGRTGTDTSVADRLRVLEREVEELRHADAIKPFRRAGLRLAGAALEQEQVATTVVSATVVITTGDHRADDVVVRLLGLPSVDLAVNLLDGEEWQAGSDLRPTWSGPNRSARHHGLVDRRVIVRYGCDVVRRAVGPVETWPGPAAAEAIRGTHPSHACPSFGHAAATRDVQGDQ